MMILKIPTSIRHVKLNFMWTDALASNPLQAARERQEAEEMQKEMGLGDQDDSVVMMLKVTNAHSRTRNYDELVCPFISKLYCFHIFQQRQKSREQNFNSYLSHLEAKYSKKSGPKGGKKAKK